MTRAAIIGMRVGFIGTGFAATAFLVPLRVEGRAGLVLADEWRDGAYAYLSMAVPGFSILDS